MPTNISLKNRIVIAFTIQTLLIVVIAFSTIGQYVDFIEETVLYEHFEKYLDSYVSEINSGKTPAVPADIEIYYRNSEKIPEYARDLGVGGHEIVLDDERAYHVLNKQYGDKLFTLIKDQAEFEKTEENINIMTVIILIVFTFVSFVFSKTLANRVIQPLVVLSKKVPQLNVDNINNVKLDYPDDELGELVKVIYDHIHTLNHYLQREKWFTGDISHELRTPMMIISSSNDLLKMQTTTDAQRFQIYQRIDGAVSSVNELINTFLLLARGKGSEDSGAKACDLMPLSNDVVEDLKSYSENKNINFSVESEGELLHSVSTPLYSIVLTNLVKNAIANVDSGEIVVTLQSAGFKVSDTGKGLPDVVKQFINGGEVVVTPRNNKHFGLGLSIVKRVCERENWTITAYDADNGGACFMISF